MNHGVQNSQSIHQPTISNNMFESFFGSSQPSHGHSYPSQGHTHYQAPSQGHTHYQAPSQGHTHYQAPSQGHTHYQAPSQGHTHYQAPSQGHTHDQASSQGHTHSYNPLLNFFGGSSYPYYTSSPYHSHGYGQCYKYPLHPYLKYTNASFNDDANILGADNGEQNFIFFNFKNLFLKILKLNYFIVSKAKFLIQELIYADMIIGDYIVNAQLI
jgi:hypothetical protein